MNKGSLYVALTQDRKTEKSEVFSPVKPIEINGSR